MQVQDVGKGVRKMENRVVKVNMQRIRNLAEKKGLNIKQLEDEAELPNGTIRKWDNSIPTIRTFYKVADFLEVSMDYLLDLEIFEDGKTINIVPLVKTKPRSLKNRKTVYNYCPKCGRKLSKGETK